MVLPTIKRHLANPVNSINIIPQGLNFPHAFLGPGEVQAQGTQEAGSACEVYMITYYLRCLYAHGHAHAVAHLWRSEQLVGVCTLSLQVLGIKGHHAWP